MEQCMCRLINSDPVSARGVPGGSDSPSWISVAKQKQKIYKENSLEEITVKKVICVWASHTGFSIFLPLAIQRDKTTLLYRKLLIRRQTYTSNNCKCSGLLLQQPKSHGSNVHLD